MNNANQSTGVHPMGGGKSAADVAAEGMRKHAEYRAEMKAIQQLKARQREERKKAVAPQRWLSHSEIYDD